MSFKYSNIYVYSIFLDLYSLLVGFTMFNDQYSGTNNLVYLFLNEYIYISRFFLSQLYRFERKTT